MKRFGIQLPSERARRLRAQYGISIEEYDAMLQKQAGLCRICLRPETVSQGGRLRPLAVDHCHRSGIVRGLLCQRCNTRLAQLEWFDANLEWVTIARKHCELQDRERVCA